MVLVQPRKYENNIKNESKNASEIMQKQDPKGGKIDTNNEQTNKTEILFKRTLNGP